MINKNIVKTICKEFNLGEMQDFQLITEGVINEKCKIITDTGSFFLKVVANKPDTHLSYVSDVESYMAGQGIPAVAMMSTSKGLKWLRFGDVQYTVYPFIEGDKDRKYSLAQYEEMGVMLAKMHKAGQEVPSELLRNAYTKLKKEDGLMFSNEQRDKILSWGAPETLEDNDKKFLEYLEYKLNLIPALSEGTTHVRDTVVHSDFHRNNILFHPETKNIIGICDWERSHYGSRVSDLARALVSCFSKGYVYETAIENAKAMFKGYIREYPISREELQEGFYASVCLVTFVPWLEEKYYNKNDKEAVNMIEHERGLIKLCLEGKILGDLFA